MISFSNEMDAITCKYNVWTLWKARLEHLMNAKRYQSLSMWTSAGREARQADLCKKAIEIKSDKNGKYFTLIKQLKG